MASSKAITVTHRTVISGEVQAQKGEESIDPALLGRIAAQKRETSDHPKKSAKPSANATFDEYVRHAGRPGAWLSSSVTTAAAPSRVTLGKSEAILPRGEQIPGGNPPRQTKRVKAVVLEVKKVGPPGQNYLVPGPIPIFVRRLFENEIPENPPTITIEIKALSREAGYRTKNRSVPASTSKVDFASAPASAFAAVASKNIVDELGGERIDIVALE